MKPHDDDNEPGLQRSIHQLADAYERSAVPEDVALRRLEQQLASGARVRLVVTIALAAAVVLAVAIGLRAVMAPAVGGPAEIPPLSGVFVTAEPDDAGSCYAVRLYDTTPRDGRVALWAWSGTAGGGCGERRDNLSAGLGRAAGVQLGSRAGISIQATDRAPPPLDALEWVLDAGTAESDSVRAYRSAQAAVDGDGGMTLERVAELNVPYRPD